METLRGIFARLGLRLAAMCSGEKGQTAIEYVLVIVLAVIAIVLALAAAGIDEAVNAAANKISDAISAAVVTTSGT
jgi:Flp pilus assembly pilin Flp